MDNEQLLQAIGGLIDQKLAPIIVDIKDLQASTQEMRGDIKDLQASSREIKRDVKKIAWQVDTLYDWVDSVDTKTKDTRELLESLPLAK